MEQWQPLGASGQVGALDADMIGISNMEYSVALSVGGGGLRLIPELFEAESQQVVKMFRMLS